MWWAIDEVINFARCWVLSLINAQTPLLIRTELNPIPFSSLLFRQKRGRRCESNQGCFLAGALLQRYWLHISDRFERAKLRAGRSFAAARSWWWASHDLCNETTAFVVGHEMLVNAGCKSRGLTGRPRDTFSSDGNGNWGFSRTAPRSERQSGPRARIVRAIRTATEIQFMQRKLDFGAWLLAGFRAADRRYRRLCYFLYCLLAMAARASAALRTT